MSTTSSPRKIVVAILFAAVCVCVALLLRTTPPQATTAIEEEVVVTAAPPRAAIPIADSDEDGVPDWQDSLQRTDPLQLNTQTASYTPPDTLTGQFAESFFEQMIRSQANGGGVNPDTLIATNANILFAQASDEPITRGDIIVTNNNSPAALKAYGNAIATIISSAPHDQQELETDILLEALNTNNPQRLDDLAISVQNYRNTLARTQAVPVPSIMVTNHLALLNSYQAVANDIAAMQAAYTDPALALVRLERYNQDVDSLLASLQRLYTALHQLEVTWTTADPAASILDI